VIGRNLVLPTVIVSHPQARHDKDVFQVFDWDDSLLCSSFLASAGLKLDSDPAQVQELSAPLSELATHVIAVLELALRYGPVTLITNAEAGWVQLSAQKFMPTVLPILNKVTIVSARSTYEKLFPDAPLKWKYYAFRDRIDAIARPPAMMTTTRTLDVFSFGDSHVEREAVRAVTRSMHMTRCKSIKFAERPTANTLTRQLQLIWNCFKYIHDTENDLDLQLTITMATRDDNHPIGATTPSTSTTFADVVATSLVPSIASSPSSTSTAAASAAAAAPNESATSSTTTTTHAPSLAKLKPSDGTESRAMYGSVLQQAGEHRKACDNSRSSSSDHNQTKLTRATHTTRWH